MATNVLAFAIGSISVRITGGVSMAKANTFVAMLMLGLLFHIEFKKEYMGEIFKLIGIRHIFAAVCAVIFYFVLPFDLVIRQTLVLLCFAPMSAVAPAYTGMCGGDEGMASCANSVSILCSLVVITALLAVYVCILKITKFCYLHENKRAFHNSLRVSA